MTCGCVQRALLLDAHDGTYPLPLYAQHLRSLITQASRIVPQQQPSGSSFIAPGVSQPLSTTPAATTAATTTTTSSSSSPLPPDLEQKLSLLSSHRSVLGYLLIARAQHHPSIIRHSGVVFEGEQGRKYAAVVARIVQSVQSGLDELRREDDLVVGGPGGGEPLEGSESSSAVSSLFSIFA
jgi:hypothetical protein